MLETAPKQIGKGHGKNKASHEHLMAWRKVKSVDGIQIHPRGSHFNLRAAAGLCRDCEGCAITNLARAYTPVADREGGSHAHRRPAHGNGFYVGSVGIEYGFSDAIIHIELEIAGHCRTSECDIIVSFCTSGCCSVVIMAYDDSMARRNIRFVDDDDFVEAAGKWGESALSYTKKSTTSRPCFLRYVCIPWLMSASTMYICRSPTASSLCVSATLFFHAGSLSFNEMLPDEDMYGDVELGVYFWTDAPDLKYGFTLPRLRRRRTTSTSTARSSPPFRHHRRHYDTGIDFELKRTSAACPEGREAGHSARSNKEKMWRVPIRACARI